MMPEATYSDLKGRATVITGGGSGIGAALTEGFLSQGARVAFLQRSDGTEFCDKMEVEIGSRPMFIRCDLTDLAELGKAMEAVASEFGTIEVLVNNAANDTRHKTEELSVQDWNRNHAINLRPYFFAAQSVAPSMKLNGGGSIINFSSISYMAGAAGLPAYVCANASITGLTRGLAREYGHERIRVNAIAPGWVLTERQMRFWATPERLDKQLQKQCLKQHLKPEEIVGGCLFLASSASRMITGQLVAIDGGVVSTG
ncbi:MAG: SDR family NAD(P)-dependent oxidoreductase [Albidovulum sp.]|nr:SDR family NAD(P)-dependent oxidoreductase [Albidovulum sp.]